MAVNKAMLHSIYCKWLWLSIGLVSVVSLSHAEEITLTTFYPSPSGRYETLETTGDTRLATNGESFVGIGTDSPVAELDIRHPDSGQLTVHLSSSDQEQVSLDFFTKGVPTQKELLGQTDVKAWRISAIGSDHQTLNAAPNDQRNHLDFSFYDGTIPEEEKRFIHTMALGPGKVGIRQLQPKYELDVNGTIGIGRDNTGFGSEIFAGSPTAVYAGHTIFQSGATTEGEITRHGFHFSTNDQSDAQTTQKTIADVLVDGKVVVGEDVSLVSTQHSMSQTGFVTGSYQGDGSANRLIGLNEGITFKPRYVKIWCQSFGPNAINASVFEKTQEMRGGFAIFSFSEDRHQSVLGGSPTRNEDTIGRTFTYFMDASLVLDFNGDDIINETDGIGFKVSGTDNSVSFSGYFETNGLAPDDSGLQYFYIAYR